MKKKILALLLLAVFALSLVACGQTPSTNTNTGSGNTTTAEKVRWEVPVEGFDTEAEITITLAPSSQKSIRSIPNFRYLLIVD